MSSSVSCMEKHTDPTTVALIEGRDKTAPEYRAHYVIGVARSTAHLVGSQVWLARQELDRMAVDADPVQAQGVGYILEKLDKIDKMIGDMEAVAS